jgi:PhnB protein
MASTSTYLNFARTTEEAFTFYTSVFGAELVGPIVRFADIPPQEGQPEMSEAGHLFAALSTGGTVEMPLQEMFWEDCFASFADRFGV